MDLPEKFRGATWPRRRSASLVAALAVIFVTLAAAPATASPITYAFSDVSINFADGLASVDGMLAVDGSTFQYTDVDFYLYSPDPNANGHYISACCGPQTSATTFVATPINTRLTLAFGSSLGINLIPVPITFAQLDLTQVGQPTYSTYDITGTLTPVPEPSTFWLLGAVLVVFLFANGAVRLRGT